MSGVERDVLVEAASRGGNLHVTELVELVERAHDPDAAGVSREVLDAYITELGESLDGDSLRRDVDNALTNSAGWLSGDALYEVSNGRVSRYPRSFHDELDSETDLVVFARVLADALDDGDVPEPLLVAAAATLGERESDEARAELDGLTADGVLETDAETVRVPKEG